MIKKIIFMFLEYLFRRKNMSALILKSGVVLVAGPTILLTLNIPLESIHPYLSKLEIEYGGYSLSNIIGFILITVSVVWAFIDETRKNAKTKFALYQSGLISILEESIISELSKKAKANVPITKVNIQKYVSNFQIVDPNGALKEVNDGLYRFIKSVQDSQFESDLYYAGLISVPFSFYTGMELDDKYNITIFDYNRIKGRWFEISKKIDSDNKITIDDKGHYNGNSLVIIGCSYPVNYDEVKDSFPNYPISCINISNVNPNNHWDKDFHSNLQQSFLELIQKLSAKGVRTIHLILAAQNSISFNLGRVYDNRNLPEIIVYQYEKGAENKYPWGLKMRTSGVPEAEIINN